MPKTTLDLTHQNLSTAWVNLPPVRKLDRSEFAACGVWLTDQIKDWKVAAGTGDANDWNSKLNVAIGRAEVVECYNGATFTYIDAYAYFYAGKPVALMTINNDESKDTLYIEDLVSHPGAKNGGDIMIEYAANISEQRGFGGKLKLSAVGGSGAFYRTVGFVGDGVMTLDPATQPDLWENRGGHWYLNAVWQGRDAARTLASYQGLQYRN